MDRHHRRSIRLCGFDYASSAAYFVTVVAQGRECLFGNVVDGIVELNDFGRIVRDEWLGTESLRPNVFVDSFVVMPNHFHGIVWITHRRGAARCAPTGGVTRVNVAPRSLSAIVRSFKSAATKRINILRGTPGVPVWQRNYWERIVRDDAELDRIRRYVADNPRNWPTNAENPKRKSPPR